MLIVNDVENKFNMIILIFALLVQSAIPAGYMPSLNGAGKFSIEICSGLDGRSIEIPQDQSDEMPRDDGGCPYFLMVGYGLPEMGESASVEHALQAFIRSFYDDPQAQTLALTQYQRGPPHISLT